MPKLVVSVTQRPPMRFAASTTTTFRPAAATRRAAAIPAAPAPITTMSASRGTAAKPERGATMAAAVPDRNARRLIVILWFPKLCGRTGRALNLQQEWALSNDYGEEFIFARAIS